MRNGSRRHLDLRHALWVEDDKRLRRLRFVEAVVQIARPVGTKGGGDLLMDLYLASGVTSQPSLDPGDEVTDRCTGARLGRHDAHDAHVCPDDRLKLTEPEHVFAHVLRRALDLQPGPFRGEVEPVVDSGMPSVHERSWVAARRDDQELSE